MLSSLTRFDNLRPIEGNRGMGVLNNLVRNSFSPGYFRVMLGKIWRRLERDTGAESRQWIRDSRLLASDDFCKSIDEALWMEASEECAQIEVESRNILNRIGIPLGGGGNYVLAYFFARKLRPDVIVETGVAAGWTTLAILRAIARNGSGELFSSDFPYFRMKNPESLVGVLVENEDKASWHLDLRGDGVALPGFVAQLGERDIGLIHYDSDKSYRGREFALSALLPRVSDNCVLIMDDIQDNVFFRDFVLGAGLSHTIFEFEGKYLGVVERLGYQMAKSSGV